jgi:hypothetical protein
VVGVILAGLYHLGTGSHQTIAQVAAQQHSTHTAAAVKSSVQEPQTEALALQAPKLGLLSASNANRNSILVRKPTSWSAQISPGTQHVPGASLVTTGAQSEQQLQMHSKLLTLHITKHQPAERSSLHPPVTQTFPRDSLTCARTR